jgi:hypothetical protein
MVDTKQVNGTSRTLTVEEQAQRDGDSAASDVKRADYIANHQYKDERRQSYPSIGDQLDMIFWDQINGTTTFKDHVAKVKAAHPKPGE